MASRVEGSRPSISSTNENEEVKQITKKEIEQQEQLLLAQTFEGKKRGWEDVAATVGGVATAAVVATGAAFAALAYVPLAAAVGAGAVFGGTIGYGVKKYLIDPFCSVTKTFAQIAEEYAVAQEGIRKGELGASDKARDASKVLEGRVAALTTGHVKDRATAIARARAAEELIKKALKDHKFDETARADASHRFLGRVGEETARNWVESIGLKIEGNIDDMVQKQAEVMHVLGYFSSVEDAKKAIKKEYAAFIADNRDEATKIKKALVDNPQVEEDDAKVVNRFTNEKACLDKLLESRNKFCEQNPKALAELQVADKKEQDARQETLRRQFSSIRLNAIDLEYYGGTLGDLAKQVRDQLCARAQNAAEIDQVNAKLLDSYGRSIAGAMREIQEREALDPSKVTPVERTQLREWLANLKKLEKLEKAKLEILAKIRELGKKYDASVKEYKKVQAEIDKKEDLLGSVEFPEAMNTYGIQKRIEEENQTWANFLADRLQEGQAVSHGVGRARTLERQLAEAMAARKAIEASEEQNGSWDRIVIRALRQIPELFDDLVQYVVADDGEGYQPVSREAPSSPADIVIDFLKKDFDEDDDSGDAQQFIVNRIKADLELRCKNLEKAIDRIATREENIVLV